MSGNRPFNSSFRRRQTQQARQTQAPTLIGPDESKPMPKPPINVIRRPLDLPRMEPIKDAEEFETPGGLTAIDEEWAEIEEFLD